MGNMTIIYHMADKDDWRAAVVAGIYLGTTDDKEDGFIHFSTKKTIAESAAKHRKGARNLVLLSVESDVLGEHVQWERARGGQLFPHLYGGLEPKYVVAAVDLPLGPDGVHIFPELD